MVDMTGDDDFDLEEHLEDRRAAEAALAEATARDEAYIARRRSEGASHRRIGDELGKSHEYVRQHSGEQTVAEMMDAKIRAQAGRSVPQGVDANEWVRSRFGRNGRRNDARAAAAASLRRSAGIPEPEES